MTTDTATWVGVQLAGRYQVTAKLGEGGMGFVYRATDGRLNTDVVIKVPRRALMEDREFAKRFAREIQSLVQLAHPHVVKVMDVGEHDGLPFAVMQCLAGGSLQDRHMRNGRPVPMQPRDLVPWLKDVAAALDFLHGQGYVHRDIKPANILFDAHGNSYLGDFGIAKALADREQSKRTEALTGSGMVLGTPEYMAPELIMGQPYDGRVDQYALAVTVYELLSAQGPFAGPNSAAVFVKQTTVLPRPLHEVVPSVPEALSAAVQSALAKDPNQRFPDCAAFAQAVLKAAGAAPAGAASEAAIFVVCPACNKKSRVPAGAAGKRVKCGSCQTTFELPATASDAASASIAATVREASPARPAIAATVRESAAPPQVAATVRESVPPSTAPARPIAATVRERLRTDTAQQSAGQPERRRAQGGGPMWLLATGGGLAAILLLAGLVAVLGGFGGKSGKTSETESASSNSGKTSGTESARSKSEQTSPSESASPKPPSGRSLKGDKTKVVDLTVTQIKTGALPCLFWADAKGTAFYTISAAGAIRRISFPDLIETAQTDLQSRCSYLAPSAEGLVVSVSELQEVWVLDEATFKVKATIAVPALVRAVSAYPLSVGVAVNKDGIYELDFKTKTSKRYAGERSQLGGYADPVMTPDGKFVFTAGAGYGFNRWGVVNGKLKFFEGTTGGHDGSAIRLPQVTADSKYFILGTYTGNARTTMPPYYGVTWIFRSDNIQVPDFTIVPMSSVVGVDTAAGYVYGAHVRAGIKLYSMKGDLIKDYKMEADPKQILVHPEGNRFLYLEGNKFSLVEVPKK